MKTLKLYFRRTLILLIATIHYLCRSAVYNYNYVDDKGNLIVEVWFKPRLYSPIYLFFFIIEILFSLLIDGLKSLKDVKWKLLGDDYKTTYSFTIEQTHNKIYNKFINWVDVYSHV